MKTKILKIGMPIMVFMFAILFASASMKQNSISEMQAIDGYIWNNSICEKVATHPCTLDGRIICKIGISIIFGTKTGTICINQLMRN